MINKMDLTPRVNVIFDVKKVDSRRRRDGVAFVFKNLMADEDYPHQGSLFFVTPCVEVAKPSNTISERLSKEEGVV